MKPDEAIADVKGAVELQIVGKPTDKEAEPSQVDNSDYSTTQKSFFDYEFDESLEECFQEKAFLWLGRSSKPRIWAIKLVLWPYFERFSIFIILVNCITLGMYDPYDHKCISKRCQILEIMETVIYGFFALEMLIKCLAMGLFGPLGYFKDSWNKLDFFIVAAGTFELCLGDGEFLSSIRAVRVLRPLRAINRVPSIRILVTLLLDTLPMLGNVLLICCLIFAVFGIIGVQLWQGVLRNRCFLELPTNVSNTRNLSNFYYSEDTWSFICSLPTDNGLAQCNNRYLPFYEEKGQTCMDTYSDFLNKSVLQNDTKSCVNWNGYYSKCEQKGENPHYGAISFDNTGLAFIAIFQVITLEGWCEIMYILQDSYSPWVWVYYVTLIVLGAYFMTNLCLVVIATQFSETRQRESALIEEAQRKARLSKSISTLASSSEQNGQGCYAAILSVIAHTARRLKRRLIRRLDRTSLCKGRCVAKKTRKRGKRKKKMGTIHFHHHHHHHIHHHHHHICPSEQSSSNSGTTPAIEHGNIAKAITAPDVALQPSTIVKIDNDESAGKVGSLAIQSTALLMPDTTVLICRSRPTSATRPNQPTHTVSFFSPAPEPESPTKSNTNLKQQAASTEKGKPPCYAEVGEKEGVFSKYERDIDPNSYEYYFQDDDSDEEDEPPSLFDKVQSKLKDFCESTPFKCIIMGGILLNTITMGMEHYGQPLLMTQVLEVFNYIFTALFTIEFLLKVFGYGLYGYIKDPFNLFDGTIVIISLVELGGGGQGGVSVLRTFRLMRVFKLVRFLPSLQRQISIMIQTLDSVMTFLALLIIFIFTSAILGMHLFGASLVFDGESVRHNFDSLLWALITVFQVLTQEDWNIVMYDAMRATSKWASMYFIILMTIGNYILFNLLVAILVEGFSTDADSDVDPDDLKISKDENSNIACGPPRTGLTPVLYQSCPNAQMGGCPPNVEIHPCTSPLRNTSSPCMQRHVLRKSMSDVVNPKTEFNLLPCPVAQDKGHSWPNLPEKYEKEPIPLPRSPLKCSSSAASKTSDREGSPLLQRQELELTQDLEEEAVLHEGLLSHDNNNNGEVKVNWFRRHENWSLTVYHLETGITLLGYVGNIGHILVRVWNQSLCANKWFDRIILFFIFLNCIILAMERPGIDPNGTERRFIDTTNNIFTGVFTVEMIIKVIAMGFVIGPDTYLKSGWNVMDCFLVVISLVDFMVTNVGNTKSGILGVLKVFRAFRTLRPLRVISRAPGLKIVVETLLSSLKPIGNLLVLGIVFFTIFGILGVQLFKGKFHFCQGASRAVRTRQECSLYGGQWANKEYNFDNLFKALLTLFVFSTKDGWVSLMYDGIDAVDIDTEPIRNFNPWAFLYFVAFMLIAGFVVINMVVGVIIDNFHRCQDEIEGQLGPMDSGIGIPNSVIEESNSSGKEVSPTSSDNVRPSKQTSSDADQKNNNAKKKQRETNRILLRWLGISDSSDQVLIPPSFDEYSKFRKAIFRFVNHFKFDLVIAFVIALNVVFMALEYYRMPRELVIFLQISNYIFTVIFIMEAVLKIFALGFRTFFSERWNQLDVIIVVLSVVGIALEELDSSLPINPTIIRIMRVLRIARILKILKAAQGIQKLLNCVAEALPQVGNLSMLFLLLFFIFSSLGIELFGKIDCSRGECEGLDRHAHFQNFPLAMLTLFRISTGDSWSGILKDTLKPELCTDGCKLQPYIAPVYFAFFVLSTQFVLVNVVVAVLMKQLEETKDGKSSSDHSEDIKNCDASEFYSTNDDTAIMQYKKKSSVSLTSSRRRLSLQEGMKRESIIEDSWAPSPTGRSLPSIPKCHQTEFKGILRQSRPTSVRGPSRDSHNNSMILESDSDEPESAVENNASRTLPPMSPVESSVRLLNKGGRVRPRSAVGYLGLRNNSIGIQQARSTPKSVSFSDLTHKSNPCSPRRRSPFEVPGQPRPRLRLFDFSPGSKTSSPTRRPSRHSRASFSPDCLSHVPKIQLPSRVLSSPALNTPKSEDKIPFVEDYKSKSTADAENDEKDGGKDMCV